MKRLLPFIFLVMFFTSLGYAQDLAVDYEQSHTVELYKEHNVSVQFVNNDAKQLEIGFGTPEAWLGVSEDNFVLNTTNATRRHNVTVSINAETDIGTFARKIPYTVSYTGGQSERELVFTITTTEPRTELMVTVFITDFTVPMFESDVGVMKISNNQTVVAFNVSLWDDMGWLSFEKNDFTLGSDSLEIVEFVVRPNLTHTEETNTTYGLKIFVKASNTNTTIVPINVHVPWFDLSNLTCDYFWEQQETFRIKKELCDAHPMAVECLTSPVEVERNVTVYVKESCNLENLTQADMNAYGVCRRDLEGAQEKLEQCLVNLTRYAVSGEKSDRTIENMLHGMGGQSWVIGFLIVMGVGYGIFKYGVPFVAKRLRG